jgi:large subunit ribosomal protein L21
MYALIEFAGKQFKVQEGSSIKVPFIEGSIGSKVVLDKVLYIDDGKSKTIGTPIVSGMKLDAEIISQGKERKIVVFKFKRRKGYQKKNSHRQEYSILKVGKVGKLKKTASKSKETVAKDTQKASSTAKKPAAKKPAAKKPAAKKPAAKKPAAKKPAAKKPAAKKETKE